MPKPSLAAMPIGRLAHAANVHVETVRYYQRLGLLAEPPRPTGGIRRYGADAVARVQFIRSAQRIGFTLDEVAQLLSLDDGARCNDARQIAEHKLDDVRSRLTDLRRIETALAGLIKRCAAGRGRMRCPLIEALQDPA